MLEALEFTIAGHRWALLGADVVEVLRAVALVPLPGAPGVIEGLVNVRGLVLPVFDLRRRFGLPPRPVASTDRLLVARAGERRVALRVDEAVGLVRFDPQGLVPARSLSEGVPVSARAGSVTGVVQGPDGLLVLHDLRGFLSEAEAATLDAALSELA